jgi:hypothetical protein
MQAELPVTADHFANHSHDCEMDNLRQPFFFWVDMIQTFFGEERHDRAINALVDYFDGKEEDYGHVLWLDTPEHQLGVFQMIMEKSR